ncbi:MAG: protein-L-isoaspartate(D-aspartate) O-methyltransferase [Gammaproteobacteria bacterium]|nr:protein-L-isoaspartate(D-aspartate) O-methyltransferase [Gammaproteobacteria bacterium]
MKTTDSDRRAERADLVRLIQREVRETGRFTGRSELNPRVIDSIAAVPRELFVREFDVDSAYNNAPLPIGHRQTISQPYIVALMTDLLNPQPGHVVLEIGTGCGYQSAVLSGLVSQVYSVEVVVELADSARTRLNNLGYANITTRQGDGNLGWQENAPFDGIIVTAGAPVVPPALIEQLKPNGCLVIPVNDGSHQMLRRITLDPDGHARIEDVLPVAFVPLVGEPGRSRP